MNNVAIINVTPIKSTGLIAKNLYNSLELNGYNPIFAYAHGTENNLKSFTHKYRVGTKLEYRIHKLFALITGLQGYFSRFATFRFLRFLSKKKIDTVFVLNIHEWYINERMLFNYIAMNNLALVYIMIDEYAFLGRCCFSLGCDRFTTGCVHCPSLKDHYPPTWFFDRSAQIFKMKQKAYSKLNRAVFVSPECQIIQSRKSPIMNGKRTEIVDEGIDVSVYVPKDTTSLKKSLGISDDKIVLLSAAPFSDPRKGCEYFLKLAFEFENDDRFVFVHVGFDVDNIETPKNFIKVGYVYDQDKYAEYLSLGDLLIFLSFADTLSNTCMAALACGTPLLCFNISGMPFLGDSSVLTLVEPRDYNQLKSVVVKTKKKNNETINICRKYAEKRYDQRKYNEKLIALAESL